MINVCVMMSTYNGEKFIRRQIESILQQDFVNITLWIRDDGSTDKTIEILKTYAMYDNIKIFFEQNIGVADSFWILLKNVGNYDYYAFADQDDVWDKDKLSKAVEFFENNENKREPMLYFSTHRKIDADEKILVEKSVTKHASVSLGCALIFSNAQGATMVFNTNLHEMLIKYKPDFKMGNILHDAWIHKVCLAIGGKVVFDSEPHLSYRIHENNVIGSYCEEDSLLKKVKRLFETRGQNYHKNIALELMKGYEKSITNENRKLIETVAYYDESLHNKLRLLCSKKIRSYNRKKNIVFKWNVLRNRV